MVLTPIFLPGPLCPISTVVFGGCGGQLIGSCGGSEQRQIETLKNEYSSYFRVGGDETGSRSKHVDAISSGV